MMAGVANARPSAAEHYADFREVFEGFGDANFRNLSDKINSGVDSDLPERFAKKLNVSFKGGIHRLIGHSWTLNAPIPQESLLELEKMGLSLESIKEAKVIWYEWSREILKYTQETAGLPRAQAGSLASFLLNIHYLGDLQPEDNVMIEHVLKTDMVKQNLIRNAEELFGKNSGVVARLKNIIRSIPRDTDEQITASILMEKLKTFRLGEALNKRYGGKCLKIEYTIERVEKAIISGREHNEKTRAARIKRIIANRTQQLEKSLVKRVPKPSISTEINGRVWRSALLTPSGELLVAVGEGAGAAVLVIAFDAGVPVYDYLKGNITQGDLEKKIKEAAIKGGSVGAAVGVSILLGASPGGVVVLAVGIAAYETADYIIQANKRKHITEEDIRVFGIEPNSLVELPLDVPVDLPTNVPVDLPTSVPVDLPTNTPVDLL